MREAVGGSWMFYFVIVFLLIYIFFMGFVMNYASTYRAANYVITQIETCQAQNSDCGGNNWETIMNSVWEKYRYRASNDGRSASLTCFDNGNGSVYRVSLPVAFDVPMLGTINWIEVKAETKTIQNMSCSDSKIL